MMHKFNYTHSLSRQKVLRRTDLNGSMEGDAGSQDHRILSNSTLPISYAPHGPSRLVAVRPILPPASWFGTNDGPELRTQ